MNKRLTILCFSIAAIAVSCKKKSGNEGETAAAQNQSETLFTRITADQSGLNFVNKVNEKDSINLLNFTNYYNGTGVAVGDIDNDGLLDLFFSANQSGCKLYRNLGNFKFEDITDKAGIKTPGWCTGTVMGDVNNDGYMDIYVCRSGPGPDAQPADMLFINNKNGTFTDIAKEAGVADPNLGTNASMFDMDNDGDLDIYVLNYPNRFDMYLDNQVLDKTRAEEGSTHHMFENLGNNKFKDITHQAGMFSFGFGLSATPGDFNSDGLMDLYVANDFMTPDLLYINNGNKTFSNKHQDFFKHTTFSSMGSDVADFNNDGLIDLMLVDMLPEDSYSRKMISGSVNYDIFQMAMRMGYGRQFMRNTLHLNNGQGFFSEISAYSGVIATDWSWSPLFADFDNDGYKDLFVSNGVYRDLTNNDFMNYQFEEMRNRERRKLDRRKLLDLLPSKKIKSYIYKNNGDLTFKNMAGEWGITDEKNASTGAAYADLDNDGDIDIVAANLNDNILVYRNNADKTIKNKYLKLKLRGSESNYFGYGAKITIKTKNGSQYYEHTGMRGFQSSSAPEVNVGLGSEETAQEITVIWPSGKMQRIANVKANQTLTINEKDATETYKPVKPAVTNKLFEDITIPSKVVFKHFEDDFVDFKRDKLVPHMLSRFGPGLAVGDVNGDGRDDFFVGNATGSPGAALYVQDNTGTMRQSSSQPWRKDKAADNMGSLFFDLENDGDMDLYIANGGNHAEGDNEAYRHFLYTNDGKGNFTKSSGLIPDITSSSSVVTGADFDGDGDIDLFVGGRVLPGQYPKTSRSYILRNDGGKLTDATTSINPELVKPGMVCAALWTDCNGDNRPDLMVTGEFMAIQVFINENGKLVNKTREFKLEQATGWWNSLTPGDFDNDGDIDYIAGNQGLNGLIKALPVEPVSIYANDFDRNGSLDPILCYYIMGKCYPHHQLKELAAQMPTIQKNYKKFAEYAIQTVEQVFKKEDLDAAYKLEAKYFASVYLQNDGNKGFTLKELPARAQFAPIFGTNVQDFDGDGNLDVLVVGNSLSPQVELGQEDALNGLVLKGDGKGNFEALMHTQTGFYVPFDAKSMARLAGDGFDAILVANNNDNLKVLRVKGNTRSLTLKSDEYKVIVTLADGKKQAIENGYGSGYLSQNSRTLHLPANAKEAEVFNFKGQGRKVTFLNN